MYKIFATINSFANSIKPKTKTSWFVFIFLLLGVSFLVVQPAFAEESIGSAVFSAFMRVMTWIVLGLATWCIQMTIFLLDFIIELAGYNGYLDTPAVLVGWVMVRDVTNMFFVVILLLIAFGTILGVEQYEWKKLMVKFVLAAILVNFSRTICGVFIDAAQVFMVTFVNAVSATAGGNLIRMFAMEEILNFNDGSRPEQFTDTNLFIAAAGGLFFAAIMMSVMFAYMIILLARMLVLWVLIILSPLAFVLSVVPQTQAYASRWWKEFTNHVMVGPVLIFFVWLSFVTAGAGNIHDHVYQESVKSARMESSITDPITGQPRESSSGLSGILEWSTMANFFIAIGLLLVGVRVTNELGVEGGSMLPKAVDFGKKAAMIGTGVAAGMWMAKTGEAAGKGFAATGGKLISKKIVSPVVDNAKMLKIRAQSKMMKAGVPLMGRGGLKREAAIKELEKGLEEQKKSIGTKALTEGKAGMFSGDTTAFVGDQTIESTNAERTKQGKMDEYVGSKTKDKQWDEEDIRDEKIDRLTEQGKVDEFDNVTKDLDNEKFTTLTEGEKQELRKLKMKVRVDARKEAEAGGETDNAKLNSIMDEAEEDFEGKDFLAERNVKNELSKVGNKNLSEAEKIVLKDEVERKTRIAKEYKELKDSGLSESERKQKSVDAGGGLSLVQKAKIEEKATKGLGMLDSFRMQALGEQRKGKAKKLEEQAIARSHDSLKNKDNKEGYALEEFNDAVVQKDLAKAGKKTYDQRTESVMKNYKEIQKLQVKKKTKEGLNREERKWLKNAVRGQATVLASAYDNGEGEWLADLAKNLGVGLDDIDLNNGENNHLLDLALLTGATKEDMFDGDGEQDHGKQIELQEKVLRENLGEKEDGMLRNLSRAKAKDASENGAMESNYQLSNLKDKNGNEVVGFSNLAVAGKTGTDNALSTGRDETGSQLRAVKTEYMLSNKKARDIGGASMMSTASKTITVNGKKVSSSNGFSGEQVRKKINTDAIDTLNNFSTEQVNFITGGQHNLSGIDSKTGDISSEVNEDIRNNYKQIMDAKKKAYDNSNQTERDRIRKEVKLFMSKAGVLDDKLDDVVVKILGEANKK